MLGLSAIIRLRSAPPIPANGSTTSQEDPMGRKMEFTGEKVSVIEGFDALSRDDLRLAHGAPLKEQVIFTGSSDWTPEQAEHYIDWRIQQVDSEIARLREQLDDLIVARKRWLAVTGGRSKMFASANGNGNGHSATNGG